MHDQVTCESKKSVEKNKLLSRKKSGFVFATAYVDFITTMIMHGWSFMFKILGSLSNDDGDAVDNIW